VPLLNELALNGVDLFSFNPDSAILPNRQRTNLLSEPMKNRTSAWASALALIVALMTCSCKTSSPSGGMQAKEPASKSFSMGRS